MKETVYLDHLNPIFYRKIREATITGSPDFLFLVQNGYKRMFHVDLLTLLSSIIHDHIRSCRAEGFKGDSIMLLSLDQVAVDCLYELMYKDSCEIDSFLVNKVIQDLTKLGFPVSKHLTNPADEPANATINHIGVPDGTSTDNQKETQPDMQLTSTNGTDEMQMLHRDGIHYDAQNDDRIGQNDLNNNVENNSHGETNNRPHGNIHSSKVSSSKSRKGRGVKGKHPLESTQEELTEFYNLFDESLPNQKPIFDGKDFKCVRCDRGYPRVRLWKEHIMNDHCSEKDEYKISPPSITNAWSNHLRFRKRKRKNSSPSNPEEPFVTSSPTLTPATTIATTTTIATSRTTLTPSALATPTKLTKKISSPLVDESSAISQECRDIQRITSLIKSLLPHPACFLAEENNLECFVCGEIFRYRDNWRRHILEQHFHLTFSCPTCGQKFKRRGKCSEHIALCR